MLLAYIYSLNIIVLLKFIKNDKLFDLLVMGFLVCYYLCPTFLHQVGSLTACNNAIFPLYCSGSSLNTAKFRYNIGQKELLNFH